MIFRCFCLFDFISQFCDLDNRTIYLNSKGRTFIPYLMSSEVRANCALDIFLCIRH